MLRVTRTHSGRARRTPFKRRTVRKYRSFVMPVRSGPRVIIIGAGAAGISAASRLVENGFTDVVILEAEDRIGGRICTRNFGDGTIDLGAQFCLKDSVVYDLVKDFDLLETRRIDTHVYHSKCGRLPDGFVKVLLDKVYDLYQKKMQMKDVEWEQYLIERFDEDIVNQFPNEREKSLARDNLDFVKKQLMVITGSICLNGVYGAVNEPSELICLNGACGAVRGKDGSICLNGVYGAAVRGKKGSICLNGVYGAVREKSGSICLNGVYGAVCQKSGSICLNGVYGAVREKSGSICLNGVYGAAVCGKTGSICLNGVYGAVREKSGSICLNGVYGAVREKSGSICLNGVYGAVGEKAGSICLNGVYRAAVREKNGSICLNGVYGAVRGKAGSICLNGVYGAVNERSELICLNAMCGAVRGKSGSICLNGVYGAVRRKSGSICLNGVYGAARRKYGSICLNGVYGAARRRSGSICLNGVYGAVREQSGSICLNCVRGAVRRKSGSICLNGVYGADRQKSGSICLNGVYGAVREKSGSICLNGVYGAVKEQTGSICLNGVYGAVKEQTGSICLNGVYGAVCEKSGSICLNGVYGANSEENPPDVRLIWKSHGYQALLDILMKTHLKSENAPQFAHKIMLKNEVARIEWGHERNVKVVCENGSQYFADHVIVTMPLGALKKQHKTLFSPSLPLRKQKAIESLGFGSILKVAFYFSTKWWTVNDFSFAWSEDDLNSALKSAYPWVTNCMGFFVVPNNPNVLMTWFVGKSISEIESCADDVLLKGAYYVLRKFLGRTFDNISKPTKLERDRWSSNPHFGGMISYETLESKSNGVTGETLAEAVTSESGSPRLLFAGEATNKIGYGCVNGAVISGFREADRIISFWK